MSFARKQVSRWVTPDIWMVKPEVKRPLGRPRRRWIENIKIDYVEVELNIVDWNGLAQDRYSLKALVNSLMNLRVP
jgi:hypothetical protein